jgi:DHA3 family tetracycline resistance protein-like MFS transporter
LTVTLVYQTQTAGLNPFQLVAVGTVSQGATFLFEIPTGVVADLRGRRVSVEFGIALLGLGFVIMGSNAEFWTILAGQVVIGIGVTFVSGAQEAWITDEVGAENAGGVFLRTAQTAEYGRLAGIPVGVGLGLVSLQLPIVLGGMLFALTALFLLAVMPENATAGSGAQRAGHFADPGRARLVCTT